MKIEQSTMAFQDQFRDHSFPATRRSWRQDHTRRWQTQTRVKKHREQSSWSPQHQPNSTSMQHLQTHELRIIHIQFVFEVEHERACEGGTVLNLSFFFVAANLKSVVVMIAFFFVSCSTTNITWASPSGPEHQPSSSTTHTAARSVHLWTFSSWQKCWMNCRS